MRWFEDRTKGAPPQAAPTGQGQEVPGSAARRADPVAPPVGRGAFAVGTGASTAGTEYFAAGTGNSAPGAGHGPLTPAEMEEFAEFRRVKKAEELRRRLQMIDHTLLKQTATREDIRKLCAEAREIGFYSVCVQPVYVAACNTFLKDAPQVKIACVVGFPMGENLTKTKVYETKQAVRDGADEIDMVICISAVKNGQFGYVRREIKKIVRAAHGRPVKVIIETSLLTRDEMVRAASCARDAGAAFVKTSTGYFGEGARAEDVRLLKETMAGKCQVKASGGIRSAERLKEMVAAGADRIGTSAGKDIAKQLREADEQSGSVHS